MKIRGVEINNMIAFYMFLFVSKDLDLPQFLDSLGLEKAVEFLKIFGGRTVKIPSLEELDKCLGYFQIMEYIHKNSKEFIGYQGSNKIKSIFNLSDEKYEDFMNYYRSFEKNYPSVFKNLFKGKL